MKKIAAIFRHVFGPLWVVEEYEGHDLYYTHHGSVEEAVAYCKKNGIDYWVVD